MRMIRTCTESDISSGCQTARGRIFLQQMLKMCVLRVYATFQCNISLSVFFIASLICVQHGQTACKYVGTEGEVITFVL